MRRQAFRRFNNNKRKASKKTTSGRWFFALHFSVIMLSKRKFCVYQIENKKKVFPKYEKTTDLSPEKLHLGQKTATKMKKRVAERGDKWYDRVDVS